MKIESSSQMCEYIDTTFTCQACTWKLLMTQHKIMSVMPILCKKFETFEKFAPFFANIERARPG